MLGEQSSDYVPQGPTGVWDLRGRRIESWRSWGAFSGGTYSRGDGEGIWKSDQHRFLLALMPLAPMLLQIDGGRTYDVHAPDDTVAFYPAGLSIRTAGSDARYAQICWDADFYAAIAPDLPRPPQLTPAFAQQDPLLAQLARSLVEETGQGVMDRLLADSLMTALAMRVARRFSTWLPDAEPDLCPKRLRRVLDYIETHLSHEVALADLAGVACLSPCHFSRSFKDAMGVGPQRYTVQRRVERAKALMRRSDHTLAGVAAAVGFADQSHFTATFRRETGITPGRFRAALA